MLDNGYIKLHRSMMTWEWYDDANVMRLFVHILLTANWDDREWRGIIIKRGQRVTSVDKLSRELKLTPRQIRLALDKLKSTGEMSIETTNKFSIITILNYDVYQCDEQDDDKQHGKQKAIKRQSKGKQMSTNEESKNPRKQEEDYQECGSRAREETDPPDYTLEVIPKPKPKKSIERKKHGEYGWVKLSDAEVAKLTADLGLSELDRCIKYVDESAQATNNKNGWTDWNLVVRKCNRDGWGKRGTPQPEKPKEFKKGDLDVSGRVYDGYGHFIAPNNSEWDSQIRRWVPRDSQGVR